MIIRTAVNRPVAVLMVFTGLVLVGILALQRLPVDLLPEIHHPNLTVVSNYADTPADDLTRLVTQPLEEVITGLEGVRRVVSRTREGISTITVQYEWGTDMDFANLHLREAVDRVAFREDYPEGAERPLILRWDPSSRPIAVLVLEPGAPLPAADPGTASRAPLYEITEFAREVVKPALEQIRGISQAEVIGGAEREIVVRPDPEKLRLYGLSVEDLGAAVQAANVSFPGGRIRKGPLHLPLRIVGEYENLDQIAETEIPGVARGLRIRDVAEVVDTTREPEGATLLSGNEVVALHLYKEVGANTIRATEEVDRILEVLAGQYPGLRTHFVYRDADFVRASFLGLRDSLVYGAILAFLVLFLFLRDLRSPIVVGLAIPVSIFATFAFLDLADVHLNLMSLGGLSLAAGMLVDNSIVVLENIHRHLAARQADAGSETTGATSNGSAIESPAAIATRATREVASPVIAATLTTVAVFFPVIYVRGIAGEFFRDQALTVTLALLVSIASALILQPTLSARILARKDRPPRGLFRPVDAALRAFYRGYHAALERTLARKRFFFAGVILFVAAGVLAGAGIRKTLLPDRNQGDFVLALELPAGTPLEETGTVAAGLSDALAAMPEVRTVYTQIGRTERTLAALKEYTAPNTARIRVTLHSSREGRERMEAVQERLQPRLDRLTGLDYAYRDEGAGLREVLGSGEAAFQLGVVSEDASDAVAAAEALLPRLREIEGLRGLTMDRVLGNPALQVRIDRERALRHGLEPDALAGDLRARVQGVVATTFNEVEQRTDVAVRFPREEREDLSSVLSAPTRLGDGRTVPISAFVTTTEERPVREVVRHNQRRQVTLAGAPDGRSLDAIWEETDAVLARTEVPEGVSFLRSGEQEEMTRSFRDLAWALVLSVVLVYMILAAQFESFLDPLIISAVLPIGAAGALLTLLVAGQSVNIISLIGIIALLGIAVNDAIVKVATIRRLREDGLELRAAVLEAGRLRFRPILMTTVTTVFAMIPLAIGVGTGEQLQRPLALAIIGGLSVATAVALLMTPALYEALHRRLDRPAKARRAPEGA